MSQWVKHQLVQFDLSVSQSSQPVKSVSQPYISRNIPDCIANRYASLANTANWLWKLTGFQILSITLLLVANPLSPDHH